MSPSPDPAASSEPPHPPERSSEQSPESPHPSPTAVRAALARLLVADERAGDGADIRSSPPHDDRGTAAETSRQTLESLTSAEATEAVSRLGAVDSVAELADAVETVGERRLRAGVKRAAECDPDAPAVAAARETLAALTALRAAAADHFRSGHATSLTTAGEGHDR
ncbi:MAG: hypothetical protein ABEJ79_03475 [Halolamina sp.]